MNGSYHFYFCTVSGIKFIVSVLFRPNDIKWDWATLMFFDHVMLG